MCVNGTWGIICRDFFDDADAKVVCRSLGYSELGILHYNSRVEKVAKFHVNWCSLYSRTLVISTAWHVQINESF